MKRPLAVARPAMDVQFPYADSHSRVRLLYRLPTPPAPARLLIVSEEASAAGLGQDWPGEVRLSAPSALASAMVKSSGARFDAVALPGVLGVAPLHQPRRRGPGDGELLEQVCGLLSPQGVVMGHLEHALALRRLVRAKGMCDLALALTRDVVVGAASCRGALRRAGLASAECYYIQPSIESPMGLIPADHAACRAHFLRAIASARAKHSASGHFARQLIAHLGIAGALQPQLFFWARRSC